MFAVLGMIFGAIWAVIKTILKAVFNLIAKLLTMLNLAVPFLYLFIGLIIHLATGIFAVGTEAHRIYWIGAAICFAFSIALTVKKILFPGEKKRQLEDSKTQENPATPPPQEQPGYMSRIANSQPAIFRIQDNPDYIVYEFYDRFQIFYEHENGELEYIRTDFKDRSEPRE